MVKRLLLIIFFFQSHSFFSQGIDIQYSSKKIEVAGELQVVYVCKNLNERGMVQGKFEPFILLGGPQISRSSSTAYVNGKYSSSTTNSYVVVLTAKKVGKFMVPKQAFQLADGSIKESQSFEVEVVKQGSLPRQAPPQQQNPFDPMAMAGFDPFDPFGGQQQQQQQIQQKSPVFADPNKMDLKKDVFARIIVNKKDVYVGEQVNASIKIYTALNSKGFDAEKLPNFNGFWSQDIPMPPKLEMKREVINGREFVSVEIKRIVLFPTKSGVLEITPLKMKTIALVPVRIQQQRNSRQPRDLFEAIEMMMNSQGGMGGVEFKEIPYSFSSGTEKIIVKPLPPNAPATFTGGVGKFTFNTLCNKKELKTDEAISFNLELTGTGNLGLIEAPHTNWGNEFEVYDPQLKENYTPIPYFNGTKSWNHVVIPHHPGTFSTPRVNFTYFDLEQKKYVTISAPPTPLKITGNPTKFKEKGKKFEQFNYAKAPIKEASTYSPATNTGNSLFYGLGLIPFGLATLIGFLPKYQVKEERFKSGKKVSAQINKQMKQAQIYLNENNKTKFYDEMTKSYWTYLSHKLHIETSDLNRSNIAEKLKTKRVDDIIIQRMIAIIDDSEMGLYTSHGQDDMKNLYDESINVLTELDKQLA